MRLIRLLAVAAVLVVAAPSPASAAPPLEFVHSEVVPLGTSTLTASFTDWPIRAKRSLDFTFTPAGGIADRTATFRAISPSGETVPLGISGLLAGDADDMELPRHPRARDAWGLDVVALREEGTWRFELAVREAGGVQRASLPIEVGPAPGPPPAASWTVGLLPWAVLLVLGTYRWIRTGPIRRRATNAWSG